MAYIAINKDGTELVFQKKPSRYENRGEWVLSEDDLTDCFEIPKGSVLGLIHKKMTWIDEPFELIGDIKEHFKNKDMEKVEFVFKLEKEFIESFITLIGFTSVEKKKAMEIMGNKIDIDIDDINEKNQMTFKYALAALAIGKAEKIEEENKKSEKID